MKGRMSQAATAAEGTQEEPRMDGAKYERGGGGGGHIPFLVTK